MRYLSLYLILIIIASSAFAANPSKTDPALNLLFALHEHPEYLANLNFAPVDEPFIGISARFNHKLSSSEIVGLESDGIRFNRVEGIIFDGGNVYSLHVPWEKIESLIARDDVIQLASHWKPSVHPCLDISNPEIQADQTWGMSSPTGLPVTGEGVIVADFDTGIDVNHPVFFRASDDTLDWIDVNNDGTFTPGTDAVDLNDNSLADAGETLNFLDGLIYDEAATFGGSGGIANDDGIYQPDWDWLYNDADDSGEREYGYSAGFSESDPCFGELVFITLDDNQNNTLDPGEKLVALGESKVLATMNMGGDIRTRGIDVIQSSPDFNGHGTAVSGVLAGGIRDIHKFTGIAPDADILMGYYFDGVPFDAYLPWVESMNCDILLYEFGGWVFNFLDGSSLEEYLIDFYASLGVMQVCPSGNLNRGFKHCLTNANVGDTTYIAFEVAEYNGEEPSVAMISILWLDPDAMLNFGVVLPGGLTVSLDGNGQWQYLTPYAFYSERLESQRGTVEYDIFIATDNAVGDYQLFIDNNGQSSPEINGYISDDVSSWQGGAEWIDYRSNMKTVTWPSTADSAFVLGSYSTRGYEQYIGVGSGTVQPGMLSVFSGRGPRIDGLSVLSVLSPGNYDVYSARSEYGFPGGHGWRQFSGTSAAGPHVAGGAVLLKQGLPDALHYELQQLLEQTAHQDDFTGYQYSDSTGYGKIRIYDALYTAGVIDQPPDEYMPRSYRIAAYPNPFNAELKIEFYLPVSGLTKITVFNTLGQELTSLNDGWLPAGGHKFRFSGAEFSSGMYFLQVQNGKYHSVNKIVLLK